MIFQLLDMKSKFITLLCIEATSVAAFQLAKSKILHRKSHLVSAIRIPKNKNPIISKIASRFKPGSVLNVNGIISNQIKKAE